MRGRQEGGELDDLRIEVLRQKAYVDRELKRHTEMCEERHAAMLKALEERELEVVAMRATVQALGRRVEELAEALVAGPPRGGGPERRPLPDRRYSFDAAVGADRRSATNPEANSASPSGRKSTDPLNVTARSLQAEAVRRQMAGSPTGQRAPRPPSTPATAATAAAAARSNSTALRVGSPVPRGPSPGPRLQSPSSRTASPAGRLLRTPLRSSPAHQRDAPGDRSPLFGSQEDESRRSITGQRGHPPFMKGPVFAPAGMEEFAFTKPSLPDLDLELQHVFGYNSRDAKGSLFYSHKGDRIIYFSAGVGISHDIATGQQRFFLGHTSEITAMAAHPTANYVATGQGGKDPCIHVWDVYTMVSRAVLRDPHDRGVCALAFTASGKFLCSVATDTFHTLLVYRWETADLVADSRAHTEEVYVAACNPFNERSLVMCGRNWIKFWDIDGDLKPRLSAKNGILGKRGRAQRLFCVHFLDKDNCVTGTEGGELYFWCGSLLVHSVAKAHKGPVFSLCSTGLLGTDESGLANGGARATDQWATASDDSALSTIQYGMISAGRDGKLLFWSVTQLQQQRRNLTAAPTRVVDILDCIPTPAPVRAVRAAPLPTSSARDFPAALALGLANNSIWEVSVDGSTAHVVAQGAGTGDLTALAPHPTLPHVASATEDKIVRVWDTSSSSLVHSTLLPQRSKCLAYSPDGSLLAVGVTGLQLLVFNAADLQLVFNTAVGNASVSETHNSSSVSQGGSSGEYTALAFSPDHTLLATASAERGLEILDVSCGFRCVGKARGLMATITNLDWSEDGKVLQTDDTHHQHLFFEWDGTFVQRPLSVRSTPWYTWTCRLGWPVQGVWPANADPSDVLSVARAAEQDACCSGQADGFVRVFRWPAVAPQAPARQYRGHGTGVVAVRFTARDERVVSAGGTSLLVWRVRRPPR
eukprot:EG_transcript_2314